MRTGLTSITAAMGAALKRRGERAMNDTFVEAVLARVRTLQHSLTNAEILRALDDLQRKANDDYHRERERLRGRNST